MVLHNYLAPLERKRLFTMKNDPSQLKYSDVKLRQEFYDYAKKLAYEAGYSEQAFYEALNSDLESTSFVGGKWLTPDSDGNQMVILAREETTLSEDTHKFLHSAVYLRTLKDAEPLLEKAKQLGYTTSHATHYSVHNNREEVGIVVPNFDMSPSKEAKEANEATIAEISRQLELKELYDYPKPIEEHFGNQG
jgi:hypothetical protein